MRTIVVSDIFGVICDIKSTVLALDGVFDTGFSAVLDVFTTSTGLAISTRTLQRRIRPRTGTNSSSAILSK
jgi:hypothetical protein